MKRVFIWCIRFFHALSPTRDQVLLSVFGFSFHCTHSPTCSEYAISQIKKHGTITGLKNGLIRIFTCWAI